MNHLIFTIALFLPFSAHAMDKKLQWLQEKVNKCKESTLNSGFRDQDCVFLHYYISAFYAGLCSGRGKSDFNNYEQQEACAILNAAVTDQAFVERMFKHCLTLPS